MKQRWFAILLCAGLMACGAPKAGGGAAPAQDEVAPTQDSAPGQDSAQDQPAVSASNGSSGQSAASAGSGFGASSPASAAQLDAAQSSLAGLLGMQSLQGLAGLQKLPDAGIQGIDLSKVKDIGAISGASALADLPNQLSQILNDPSANPLGALGQSEVLAAAWKGTGGDMGSLFKKAVDSGCAVVSSTGIELHGCSVPFQQSLVQGVAKLDGSICLSDHGLTMDLGVLGSFDALKAAGGAMKLHIGGDLGAKDGKMKGAMKVEVGLDANLMGKPISVKMSEGLWLDLGFLDGACAKDGTALATRVWSARPDDQSAATLPDMAAKVAFTSCGLGSIAFAPKVSLNP